MILLLLLILEKSINLNLELGINNNCEPPNHIAENDNGWKRQHFGRMTCYSNKSKCKHIAQYFDNVDDVNKLIQPTELRKLHMDWWDEI